jgi:hypothetical protein
MQNGFVNEDVREEFVVDTSVCAHIILIWLCFFAAAEDVCRLPWKYSLFQIFI